MFRDNGLFPRITSIHARPPSDDSDECFRIFTRLFQPELDGLDGIMLPLIRLDQQPGPRFVPSRCKGYLLALTCIAFGLTGTRA